MDQQNEESSKGDHSIDQKSFNLFAEMAEQSQNMPPESPVLMSDFKWCDSATALMLKLYREKQMKFNNPHVKKKVVWREIADVMQQNGYAFDADRCERKFLNLKTSYRNTIQHNCMTGNMSRTCAFFSELHEIFQMQIGIDDGKTPVNLQPSPIRLIPNANNVQVVPVSEGKERSSSITSPPTDHSAYRFPTQRQQGPQHSPLPQTNSESPFDKRSNNTPAHSVPNSSPNSQFYVSASMLLEASAQRNSSNGNKQITQGQSLGLQKALDNHTERRLSSHQSSSFQQRNPPPSPIQTTTAPLSHPTENGRHNYQNTSVIDLCNDRKRSSSENESRQERIKKSKNNDLQTLLASFEKYREEQKIREDDRMRMMKEFHDEEMKVTNRFLDIIQQCVQYNSDD
ncbi:uncharacterized protein LOC143059511 isoform X1 [Mytilus galloprovincialis]|uniref:uncharacterized protein LOC143059511 isoform X1 n=1 Tax=Mytilus galloprovincialis TaxID=29158 RepID=UPI003F7B7553